MAKSTGKTQRPSFHEVVIEGSFKVAQGFMAGLRLGCGEELVCYYAAEEGVHCEKAGSRLKSLVSHHRDIHLIVDTATRDRLRSLAERMEQQAGLRLASSRHIRKGTFPFRYKAYAPRYTVEIKGILNTLPDGIRLEDFDAEEKVDEHAIGVEAYAPAHDYEASGAGKITGRIDLLIEARRKLDEHPLVEAGRIELSLA
jgi:hypothetical protein